MATETGTWTDVHNFATKLSTFAVANGWTQDKIVSGSGIGTNTELYLHKGSMYFSFHFQWSNVSTRTYRGVSQSIDFPFVEAYGNTGFNTGNTVSAQPGSCFIQTNDIEPLSSWWFGPGRYFFFTNATSDYIHCVITKDTSPGDGDYQHLVFGTADTLGPTADDGRYVDASQWSQAAADYQNWEDTQHAVVFDGLSLVSVAVGAMRVSDTVASPWKRIRQGAIFAADPYEYMIGGIRGDGLFFPLDSFAHEGTYRTTLVLPIILCPGLNEDQNAETDKWDTAFQIKDTRQVYMKTIAPEEIINDGVDDWRVFPAQRKSNPSYFNTRRANSGYIGIAYKVI